jgi:hypothetical protein
MVQRGEVTSSVCLICREVERGATAVLDPFKSRHDGESKRGGGGAVWLDRATRRSGEGGPNLTGGRRWSAATRCQREWAAPLNVGQGRDWGTDRWDPGTVTGGGEFDSNSNFKPIQIIFKFF